MIVGIFWWQLGGYRLFIFPTLRTYFGCMNVVENTFIFIYCLIRSLRICSGILIGLLAFSEMMTPASMLDYRPWIILLER